MSRMIRLNGREYPLRFSVNAVCCLEERLGGGLETLLKTQLASVRALLWCALLEGEKPLTMEETGALLQAHLSAGGNLAEVAETLGEALRDAGFFPHPAKMEGTENPIGR